MWDPPDYKAINHILSHAKSGERYELITTWPGRLILPDFQNLSFNKEMEPEPKRHRGSYRTHRRSLARKKDNEELKRLRELVKESPQPVAPAHPDPLITGYPDPQQVSLSVAEVVERATRELTEKVRQLESHVSQLQWEAKEHKELRSKDRRMLELLSLENVRLMKELKSKESKASTPTILKTK